ncbi:Arf family GTPase [Martiniozyma asiatica (nom. inval.)]|nr:Arf family GTPase [Martiniozyma asiatica]
MFHLVQSLYNNYTQTATYNVLLLGLDNAGKSSLLESIKSKFLKSYNPPKRILPTVGQNVSTIPLPLSKDKIALKFWDVGGQDQLRELWDFYYPQAHAILFVVDTNDPDRIEECKKVIQQIVMNDATEGVVIVIVGNKMDIDTPKRLGIVELKECVNPLFEHLNAKVSRVVMISAITGEGVPEVVEWVGNAVVKNKDIRKPRMV